MWSQIVNPETGNKVNINGSEGQVILKNYLSQIGGASFTRSQTGEAAQRAEVLRLSNIAESLDMTSINSMSFCPTIDEILALIDQSNIADEQTNLENPDKNLLSKSHAEGFAAGAGLLPATRNPNDTILARIGRGDVHISLAGTIGDNQVLTVINDVGMPYMNKSNGPNGVLTDCQVEYGKNRINLFHESTSSTKRLLHNYLFFRNEHFNEIFDLFCQKLQFHQDSGYILRSDKREGDTLDELLIEDYDLLVEMFKLIQANGPIESGVEVVSYCQTWLRNGGLVGEPQFSVMSPHFQTRFFIGDASKLAGVPGLTPEHLEAYIRTIDKFSSEMQADYGGGAQSFINLDRLGPLISQVETLERAVTDDYSDDY